MTRPIRDIAASVRQRLGNLAKAQNRPHQELLQYFAIERFLHRLAISRHRDRFVLKGALMLTVWRAPTTRPTMDIDLLGSGRNRTEELEAVVRELCGVTIDPADGLAFEPESVVGEEITIEAEYVGVRITFRATLGTARIPMQVDVGFGDAVVDADPDVELPTLLDFPAPRLRGYSRETAIAEKLNAMFQHGRLNSRMKDYFDVLLLASHFAFDGGKLADAIRATFERRETPLQARPVGLTGEFAEQPDKQVQWAAFLRKIRATDAPAKLEDAVDRIGAFLLPVLAGLVESGTFGGGWEPGGPWVRR
ncbi:MAG: nucleotidyl transferase AbiEii/AbiGii toxin family protein [Planctomycetes bacterium]|nr:nucleotidyl transferase AbiEii/AbiGii toxin family protein [Planctomycetota bacterium]